MIQISPLCLWLRRSVPSWVVFALSGLGLLQAQAPESKLNLLVLYADDWRHDTLGCAGHPVVKTPHLDALAREGVRFRNHYVTTSICGVSRATLFTGQWMSRHRNRGFQAFETPWSETYPGVLRESGYFIGQIGKWHNGAFPKERFDFGRAYGGRYWMPEAAGERVHVTLKNERDAMQFLRMAPSAQPFCLTLAFFATHAEDGNPEQFLPQRSSEELYADTEIPMPAACSEEEFKRLPAFLRDERNEGRVRWHWRFDNESKRSDMMRRYYRLVTEVDAACGRLIDVLRERQLLDQTLVIFTTDNGYFHGEHRLADKWYPYEESIRVPCIVRDPRLATDLRGKEIDAMTLSVDIAPTLLHAAGATVPSGMQGVDLAPLYLAKEAPAWREEFYYEHPTIDRKERIPTSEALVRLDLKYIYWPEYEYEELFDLSQDPHETQNLANDPARAPELVDLRQRLAQLRTSAR